MCTKFKLQGVRPQVLLPPQFAPNPLGVRADPADEKFAHFESGDYAFSPVAVMRQDGKKLHPGQLAALFNHLKLLVEKLDSRMTRGEETDRKEMAGRMLNKKSFAKTFQWTKENNMKVGGRNREPLGGC